jgi:hypothetical protein
VRSKSLLSVKLGERRDEVSRGSLLGSGTYLKEGMEGFDKRVAEAKHGRIRVCSGTQVGMVSEVL